MERDHPTGGDSEEKNLEANGGWSVTTRMIRCSGGGRMTEYGRMAEYGRMNPKVECASPLKNWQDKNNLCLYFMSVNTKSLLYVKELLVYFIYRIKNQV